MIVCSTVCSGADQRKHQSFPSQRASNEENVSIRWCKHSYLHYVLLCTFPAQVLRVSTTIMEALITAVMVPGESHSRLFRDPFLYLIRRLVVRSRLDSKTPIDGFHYCIALNLIGVLGRDAAMTIRFQSDRTVLITDLRDLRLRDSAIKRHNGHWIAPPPPP